MNKFSTTDIPEGLVQVVDVFSALGDITRQKIIMLFDPGEELSIKDIADQFDLGRTTVVHHLTVLYNSGVLNMRRKGRQTLYSVAYEEMLSALQKTMLFVEDRIWAANKATMRANASIKFDADFSYSDEDDLGSDMGRHRDEAEYSTKN